MFGKQAWARLRFTDPTCYTWSGGLHGQWDEADEDVHKVCRKNEYISQWDYWQQLNKAVIDV